MLTIRYALTDGETGQAEITGDDKWTFGRADAAEPPTVATNDGRISRHALTIRDSGPGPVVFRGQRGDGARVLIVGSTGPVSELGEGTATNLTADANRVELWLGDDMVLRAEVEFDVRGTVRERQDAAEGGEADATDEPPG